MCMAVPCKVLQVANGQAEVLYEGKPLWVQTPGISDLREGEYVAVYAGKALNRMTAEEAADVQRVIEKLADQEDEARE